LPPAPTWREPDPRGLAAVDEAVVERMLAGNPPDVIRPVDKREALRRLWAAGLTHRQVADRLRMDIEAVRRTYHRMARRAV
jgi:DNA-directed RNA polymerase specialized sigma24 family protein